jgi:hypothetical protein
MYDEEEEEEIEEDKPKKEWHADTTNQNLDGWRRINKNEEVDGPPEYPFDDEEFKEDETTAAVIAPPEKYKRRSVEKKLLETGFTEAKEIPPEFVSKKTAPILEIDAGTIAKQKNSTSIYYPVKENEGTKGLPQGKIYVRQEDEENLPPGVVREYEECNITIKLNFYKQDWDMVYGLIKRERDTIKQFARRAMVKYAEEMLAKETLRKKMVEELTRAEIINELKAKLSQEIAIEKIIWQKKYEERDPDAVKLYPSLNEEMRKELEEEEAERTKLAERLKKKAQKDAMLDAREARARARALRKQPEDEGKEIEAADNLVEEDLGNIQNGPPPLDDSELNKEFQFETEGVMLEEKGIPLPEDTIIPEEDAIHEAEEGT